MTILDEIAGYAKERVAKAKQFLPADKIKQMAYSVEKGDFLFEKALKEPGLSFILECKKASPSKGIPPRQKPRTSRRPIIFLLPSWQKASTMSVTVTEKGACL